MHNPFLANGRLRSGQFVAYPAEHRRDLLREVPGGAEYRMRHGDNYLILAFSLGISPDDLRSANGLWQIQSVPAGTPLRIPFTADRLQLVRSALGDPLAEPRVDPDGDPPFAEPEQVREPVAVAVASVRRPSVARAPRTVTHRVTRGETLASLARRYDTTIKAIQQANRMGRRTSIRVGERLRIPSTDAVRATD
jgi:membrane-bound lytic murein transglycosylase D